MTFRPADGWPSAISDWYAGTGRSESGATAHVRRSSDRALCGVVLTDESYNGATCNRCWRVVYADGEGAW